METQPHVYVIAGEPSGDRLGARLIAALKSATDDHIQFSGVGGPKMESQGLASLFPMSELSVMGFAEVLPQLPNLLRRIRETAKDIRASKPDVVVTIDAPDFSLRVAKRLKGSSIPLVHYVAPSVWAWKPGRAKKIAAILDHLLTLLPFEPPYFEKEGLASTFVGHAVIESGANEGDGVAFHTKHDIAVHANVLCVLPGSRHSEVSRLLPIIRSAIEKLKTPDLHLVLPTVETVGAEVRQAVSTWPWPVTIVTSDAEKFDAFAASHGAIAASGTVSLELALARVPYVTIYKVNKLTGMIARRMIKTPFANIINILLDRQAVPELIQENCRADMIASKIDDLLIGDDAAMAQIADFEEALSKLQSSGQNPSDKAAAVVLDVIAEHAKLSD